MSCEDNKYVKKTFIMKGDELQRNFLKNFNTYINRSAENVSPALVISRENKGFHRARITWGRLHQQYLNLDTA